MFLLTNLLKLDLLKCILLSDGLDINNIIKIIIIIIIIIVVVVIIIIIIIIVIIIIIKH